MRKYILALVLIILTMIGILLLIKDEGSMSIRQQGEELERTKIEGTRWTGLIAGEAGLLEIIPEQEDVNYLQQQQSFLPPGVPVTFWKSLADYAHEDRKRFVVTLDDGRIVFIGSPEISTAPDQNTLYSWSVDSKENPVPFVRIANSHKIKFFTLSPNKQKVALVAITRSEEEIYNGLDNLNSDEQLAAVHKRVADLENELRTIFIYETSSSERTKTLKIGPDQALDPKKGLTEYEIKRLIWNQAGLFVVPLFAEAVLLDPEKEQTLATLKGNYRRESIRISPDGQYYIWNDLVVKNTLTGEIAAQISLDDFKQKYDIIALGPYIFSPDSKKVAAIVASDPTYDDFVVFETNIETGNTERIGGVENLEAVWGIPKSGKNIKVYINVSFQEHIESLDVWFSPYEVFYGPQGKNVYFLVGGYENPNRVKPYGYAPQLNLIKLIPKEQKTNVFDLPSLNDNRAHITHFIGWYKETQI